MTGIMLFVDLLIKSNELNPFNQRSSSDQAIPTIFRIRIGEADRARRDLRRNGKHRHL